MISVMLTIGWLPAAAEDRPPVQILKQALMDSAQVVLQNGSGLLIAARSIDPEAANLRDSGRRLIQQAEKMMAHASDFSIQVEQAARTMRGESAALRALAEESRLKCGRHPQVIRNLLAEAERLDRLTSEAPTPIPGPVFEGLALGVNRI